MDRTVKTSRAVRRLLVVVLVAGAGLFILVTVMTWPSMFISEGRELMGIGVDLKEVAKFDDGSSREGVAVWVYPLPDGTADALDAGRAALRNYPMRSGLAFDGYRCVRWQTLDELKAGPDRILAGA